MTTKGTDNRFRSLTLVGEAGTPSTPASGDFKLYVADDGTFFLMDDTGATVDLTASGFSDPMTTRGDIIVRNASNVTARLAKGSADTFLHSDGTDVGYAAVTDAMLSTSDITTNNASTSKHGFLKKLDNNPAHFMDGQGNWSTPSSGGVSSGASNPGSPTNGDLFYRTDLGLLIRYYSSGTKWLCVCPHEIGADPQLAMPLTGTGTSHRGKFPEPIGADIWIDAINTTFFVSGGTALGASHKWVGPIAKSDNAGGTSSLGTFNIDSGTSSVWRKLQISVGAAGGTTYYSYEVQNWTKTGTPGNLYVTMSMTYHHLVT